MPYPNTTASVIVIPQTNGSIIGGQYPFIERQISGSNLFLITDSNGILTGSTNFLFGNFTNLTVGNNLIYSNVLSSVQNDVLTVDATGSVKKRTFINVITKSAAFNLTSSEEGYYIRYTGASNINLTILSSSVEPMPINSIFTIMQAGVGVVSITGSTGTVIVNGDKKTGGQYKAVQVVKVDTDTFDVIGGVA